MVESNQAQRWFVQTAKDEGLNFRQTSSSGSKEDRIISMSSRFESGKIKLYDPTSDPTTGKRAADKWRGFINEWAAFPTGAHDDRLDSTEIAMRAVGNENISVSSRNMSDLPVG
jgi:predicted phage terminase large subunit-like protein